MRFLHDTPKNDKTPKPFFNHPLLPKTLACFFKFSPHTKTA
ncbi:hypothetical protein [Helicobacter pylori]|nr:hypothetical protein [Helicobacter pylori]